jgi:hypothetical protein
MDGHANFAEYPAQALKCFGGFEDPVENVHLIAILPIAVVERIKAREYIFGLLLSGRSDLSAKHVTIPSRHLKADARLQ